MPHCTTSLRLVNSENARVGDSWYNGRMSDSDDMLFHPFDPACNVDRSRRNFPHWFQPETTVFLTFRTIDSMPRDVVLRRQDELENWLKLQGLPLSAVRESTHIASLPAVVQREFRRLSDRLWHGALDECHGACVLRRPALANIVRDALRYFDGDRYDLDSLVVMPNHVHLLVQFRTTTTLKAQSESWLRYSARQINLELGQQGPFWRSEPFDHLVRSLEQFEYLQQYIADNPRKANLSVGEYLYWSRRVR